MTPRVAQYIDAHRLPTPSLILDLDRVRERFEGLRGALPEARIYYAIKANPAPEILRLLASLGSCFDAASYEEIEMALAAGASPDRISYGNTVKKSDAIRRAFEAGVRLFVFDSQEELDKIADHAPGARVYCRLMVGNEGAVYPLARKFGTSAELATELMVQARERGLDPYGLSFHVGSQQTGTQAHAAAIGQAAMVFEDLAAAGITLRMLNLGGGFPARYQEEVPDISRFGHAIMHALTFHFGNDLPEILVEPGRYMVADAGAILAEVVLVARKTKDDPVRWVYLDIGRFGGLAETEDEMIKYEISAPRSGEEGPVIIAGPTCDSADTLYEKAQYRMPLSLRHGDRVVVQNAGAYTTTYASQGFNGFPPMREYYI